jgi:putative copper resistance protein D
VLLAGVIFFGAFVAGPTLRTSAADALYKTIHRQLSSMAWLAFVVALASGVAWLVLLASEIGGNSPAQALADGTVWTVLTKTQFGTDGTVRLAMASVLALVLCLPGGAPGRWAASATEAIAVLVAGGLLGSLAWAGHAAATPGAAGTVHIAADTLHLIAVGAWVGALLPLAIMLRGARTAGTSNAVMHHATRRFSMLGTMAVAVILLTGLVNTYELSGTTAALVGTDYGRLLLAKIGLFVAMVVIAAVNRLRLAPRLAIADGESDANRQLQRNSLVELGFGIVILGIVAVLGRMPPNAHDHLGHH